MFSAQLLIELARERHADLLRVAERERIARRLRPSHRHAALRLARLRAFALALPHPRTEA
jgi:hypothetical protein